ncbi:hypothetical protein CSUI_002318 [Cystoisospora suis]|uniref:Uncharacterized protein n=1 Tax=Cystoisospora suis TaxID=483139 RepID=A0A2C6L8L1_9APIC|nr:hypothetical protein CSUI_002318 [Cystoisospora suis]
MSSTHAISEDEPQRRNHGSCVIPAACHCKSAVRKTEEETNGLRWKSVNLINSGIRSC